jgi:TolB protein
MIRKLRAAAISSALVLLCASVSFGQSDVIINIHEPGAAKIKIGVPDFSGGSGSSLLPFGMGRKVAEIIRGDLTFTGLFEVFPTPPNPAGMGGNGAPFTPLKAWVPLDVQAVVQGTYEADGDRIKLGCALYDVESETRIVGKSYLASPRALRRSAHKFADEIVYRYTGKRGVAGTSIAYVIRQGKRKEIHVMDYDGDNSYRLTFDNSIALSPDWSPDGRKLIFTSYKDRNPDAFIIDLEKKSYTRISGFIGLNTAPAFSPDGKTLALTLSKSGNPEIYLMDVKSGELERLTKNRAADTSPTWSPNGRELAFVSDRSGYPQIYIIDREGVNLRRLTYSGYNNTSPAWSPEGDKIAYVSMTKSKGSIYTIHPGGSALARLTFDGGNEDPSWSPCGSYLAYSSEKSNSRNIYLMRADGSGKRQITIGGGDKSAPSWSP